MNHFHLNPRDYPGQDVYGVLGNPVAHSLSPKIHRCFSRQTGCKLTYEAISVPDLEFEQTVIDFFRNGGSGLNITHPYKMRAYAMHDYASFRCHQAQAANTLWWENGKLHADNTDGVGLVTDLNRYTTIHDQHILILGAGGATQGILGDLKSLEPLSITIANRTAKIIHNHNIPVINYGELHDYYTLIIHATSATNQPNICPGRIFQQKPFCYDLNYNSSSSFITYATQAGCAAINGLGMLIEQAAESFMIWHGLRPQTKDINLVRNIV